MEELREKLVAEVGKTVIGQEHTVDALLSALVIGGHVLLEGVPGVAKTLLARTFAAALGLSFSRIQFTPDMLPSDVTGHHHAARRGTRVSRRADLCQHGSRRRGQPHSPEDTVGDA